METIAYHFRYSLTHDRNGDPIPPVGEWQIYTDSIEICKSGFHGSFSPYDALQHANSSYLDLIEVDNIVEKQEDKFVCRKRRIIKSINAEAILCKFARLQALSVLKNWKTPIPDVVKLWLETGEQCYNSAAWSAAWSAANSAARSAGESAANSAARYAANSAARSAGESAANSAARSAADFAARSAAWSAVWSAANSAAWSAAWSAANSAAKEMLSKLVIAEFDKIK